MTMLWVSITAPLSWFIIFKGHSYLHTHMNPIVWYMPFMLLGFVLTGSTCRYILQGAKRRRKEVNAVHEPHEPHESHGSDVNNVSGIIKSSVICRLPFLSAYDRSRLNIRE